MMEVFKFDAFFILPPSFDVDWFLKNWTFPFLLYWINSFQEIKFILVSFLVLWLQNKAQHIMSWKIDKPVQYKSE